MVLCGRSHFHPFPLLPFPGREDLQGDGRPAAWERGLGRRSHCLNVLRGADRTSHGASVRREENIAMTELAFLSAIEIARQIRDHRVSSREALDYFLARIQTLDHPINSVVTIDAPRARMEADAADAALAR